MELEVFYELKDLGKSSRGQVVRVTVPVGEKAIREVKLTVEAGQEREYEGKKFKGS